MMTSRDYVTPYLLLLGIASLLATGCTGSQRDRLELTSVRFTSLHSVMVQWRYWSVVSHGNRYTDPHDIPHTQLDVYQNESSTCGQNNPLEIHNKTNLAGYYGQVVWGVDSRYDLTACVRVYHNEEWQDWITTTVAPAYRMPPTITQQPELPEDVYSSIRDKRVIHCGYTGSEPLRWEWIINGQSFNRPQNLHNVSIESGTKLVVGEHDTAEFKRDLQIQCRVSNDHGTVASDTVTVKKPSLVPRECKSIDYDHTIEVNYTAGAVLSCDSYDSSYPAMKHTWRFCPGTRCRAQAEIGLRMCPRVEGSNTKIFSVNGRSLVFPHVTSADEGCYVCESRHTTMTVTCSSSTYLQQLGHTFNFNPKILLHVPEYKLNADGTPQIKNVYSGGTYTLECAFQGKPVPEVFWYHDGTPVDTDARHALTEHNTILTISDLQSTDEGEYKCVARNSVGAEADWNFKLHVHDLPVINSLQPQSTTVGENVTFLCDTNRQTTQITWYKDEDREIQDDKGYVIWDEGHQLTILNAALRDTASIKCQAENRYGKVQESTSLLVMDPVQIQSVEARLLDVSTGVAQYQVHCNVTNDPNLPLEVTWLNSTCSEDEVARYVSAESPDTMYLTINMMKGVEQKCFLPCVAKSRGHEVCMSVQLPESQDSLGTDAFKCGDEPLKNRSVPDSTKPALWKMGQSTEETTPWYQENLYVIIGTVGAFLVLLIACIIAITRWHTRKRVHRNASRLSNYGSGGALLPVQYIHEDKIHMHVGFVNNSLYPTSFTTENIKNQLKEVEIPRKHLTLGEMIGRGQFGRVYKGTLEDKTYMNNGTNTVAIKTLKYKADESDMVDLFLREALMMKGFNHPHVLSLIGITMDTDRSPLVVLPYMDRGDLRTYISSPDLDFRVLELLKMGVQVANGMAYLAAKRFIHRDLAARNCMVDKLGTVKVADFGLSRDLYSGEYYRTEDGKNPLPIRWMACESLESKIFTSKSDVWSFGVLLWELVTRGATPYPGIENWAIARHIHQGGRMKQPIYCPNSVYEMMLECWAEIPKLRPTFEVLQAKLECVTETASAVITEAPGGPMERRGTLHMDIRTTKVTKCRGADGTLPALMEVP